MIRTADDDLLFAEIKAACIDILGERRVPDGVAYDFAPILAAVATTAAERRLQAAVHAFERQADHQGAANDA